MASLFLRQLLVFLSLCIIQSDGVLRFANYYQDNMVLQRAPQRAVVWGYGDANVWTTLWINNKFYYTISEAGPVNKVGESIWSVTLDAESAEGPFEILVTQPVANGTLVTITLKNVLYGDVWICSGQSNMAWAVSQMFNGSTEIAAAGNYPKIRLFGVARLESASLIEEIRGVGLRWSVASPAIVGNGYASAVCWLYGRMIQAQLNGRPIGLINTSWGGTAIELWMPRQALTDCGITKNEKMPEEDPDRQPESEKISATNTELYNGMIYPFTRMVITGALWYQGESNAGYNREKYICTFSKLIEYWRQVWNTRTNGITNPTFPFGFVQLSTNTASMSVIGGFPWIRWYQTFGVGHVPNNVVPNVFMAAAMDLRDDPSNIHPRTKTDVGYRLSRAGLAVAYGQQVEYLGPIVSNVVVNSDSSAIDVTYTSVTGIEFRSPNGFETCCLGTQCTNENVWVATPASLKNSLTVTLTVPASCVSKPIYGIRYLWRETPCEFKLAAVYSATDANLPSPPYRKVF